MGRIDGWTRQIYDRLAEHVSLADLSHHIHVGALRRGERRIIGVDVASNQRYRVIAVCDQDCQSVGVNLLRGGRITGQGGSQHGQPVLEFDTYARSRYELEVRVTCYREPCYYGVALVEND